MTHLESLNLLIDKASAIAGSDYKLAQTLGVGRQVVSNWRHGRKTATPEDQVLIAGVAGLDVTPILARAIVEKHEGTAKGDRLMKVLGKALLATGAVIGSAGASAAAISSTILGTGHLTDWLVAINTMMIMLN
jgi:DNA-binding transcriptional regulator YdaS (Cro superfamily)